MDLETNSDMDYIDRLDKLRSENAGLRKALASIAEECHSAQYVNGDEKLHRRMWQAVEMIAGNALQ
jgi:hypothetical protein